MTRSILFTSALFGAEALTGRQSDLMVGKSQQFSVRNAIEHLLNEFTKESDHNQKAMKKLEKEEHDRTCKLDEKIEKAEAALAEATTQLDDANARIAADKGIVGKVSSEIEKTERQIDQETETLETTSATWRVGTKQQKSSSQCRDSKSRFRNDFSQISCKNQSISS